MLMTTREMCDRFNITRQTAHNLRREGSLPFQQIDKRTILYEEKDVLALMSVREDRIRRRQAGQAKVQERRGE